MARPCTGSVLTKSALGKRNVLGLSPPCLPSITDTETRRRRPQRAGDVPRPPRRLIHRLPSRVLALMPEPMSATLTVTAAPRTSRLAPSARRKPTPSPAGTASVGAPKVPPQVLPVTDLAKVRPINGPLDVKEATNTPSAPAHEKPLPPRPEVRAADGPDDAPRRTPGDARP